MNSHWRSTPAPLISPGLVPGQFCELFVRENFSFHVDAPCRAWRQKVGEGLDEFGWDPYGVAELGGHDRTEHGNVTGFTRSALERIAGCVGQPWDSVATPNPDAVLLDKLLDVDSNEWQLRALR